MKNLITHPYVLTALFFIFFIMVYFYSTSGNSESKLQYADHNYRLAEQETTVSGRKEKFNAALNQYLSLEKEYQPRFGNGKLYYNIANTYYQLQEYPMAIYYYYLALNLMPHNEKVIRNLNIARNKQTLPKVEAETSLLTLFAFGRHVSLPFRLQLFFWLTFIFFISASLYLWKEVSSIFYTMLITGICSSIIFLGLMYTLLFSPLEGILVHASYLKRDAGKEYANIQKTPLPGGTKVVILSSLKDGSWLKVSTDQGQIGYIQSDSVKPL